MMQLLIQYLFKLFISLAVVYLFYQVVLRRLTFYNFNRWYLLGYTLLSIFIPFINISPVVENNEFASRTMIQFIPSVETYTTSIERVTQCPVPVWSSTWDKWDWMLLIFMIGAGFLLLRFVARCLSFWRLRRRAKLILADGMKLYHVDEPIIPFSFGNSIFINRKQHNEAELQEIIRHEFVHVKQKHTLDIIWSEVLCIFNWYNPFAWLLKMSIRQNLEFIADNKVLENGINKKQYQYLLLKVIGNNHFSIANQFNFSSLKKRIAMMNKMRTARVHLLRFLFILPLLAVILISFRQKKQQPVTAPAKNETGISILADSIPEVTEPNEKGYIINIKDNKGNCTIVVKDKNGKEVKRLLLTEWNRNEEYYENLYGEIPPPPPPVPPAPPAEPATVKLPDHVQSIHVTNDKATVRLDDGSKETYDLGIPGQKAAFEKKYGEMPKPPAPPAMPDAPHAVVYPGDGHTVIAPMAPLVATEPGEAPHYDEVPAGIEDVLVVITRKTSRQELDDFIRQMKGKGIDLKFDNIDYDDGVLVSISGTMSSKDGHSNFVVTDFDKLTLSVVRSGDRSWFKVRTTNKKVVI